MSIYLEVALLFLFGKQLKITKLKTVSTYFSNINDTDALLDACKTGSFSLAL